MFHQKPNQKEVSPCELKNYERNVSFNFQFKPFWKLDIEGKSPEMLCEIKGWWFYSVVIYAVILSKIGGKCWDFGWKFSGLLFSIKNYGGSKGLTGLNGGGNGGHIALYWL